MGIRIKRTMKLIYIVFIIMIIVHRNHMNLLYKHTIAGLIEK